MGEFQYQIRYPDDEPFRRISLTVPQELVSDLDVVTDALGVTRSALVTCLLRDHVSDLAGVIQEFDGHEYDVTTDDVRRLRGQSASVVVRRLEQLERLLHE